jgi:exonuclease III
LADLLNKNKEPILIGGDFNIIRFSTEKNKGGIHKHSGVFNSIINTYELIDLGMTGGKFTWSNKQNNPTLERLDRYLVSKSWEDIFPMALVSKKPRKLSDHNPLILSMNTIQHKKELSFKFEMAWLKHQDFFRTGPIYMGETML